MAQKLSQTTTEHETIRRWVEERGGWPAEAEATARGGGGTGIIGIDFPGLSGEGKLRRIAWDEWFQKFDESRLAFVYQDSTAGGQRSSFNKLVSRDTAQASVERGRTSGRGASRRGASRGGARGGGRAAGRGATASRGGPSRAGAKRAAAKRRGGRRQAARAEAARTTRRGSSKRGAKRGSRRGGR